MASDLTVEKNKFVMTVPHDGHARVVTFILSVLLHLCVVAVFLLNPMWNKSASTAPDVGDAFLVSIVTPETVAATVENPNPEKKLADRGLIKKEENKNSQNIMSSTKVENTGMARDDDFVAGSAKAKADYYDRVRTWIAGYKTYPRAAGRRGEEGIVVVSIMLDRSGAVTSKRVVRSSGHHLLDDAALRAVDAATPVPAFPNHMREPRVGLNVQFNFELD